MGTAFDAKKYPILYRGSVKNLRTVKEPSGSKPGRYLFEYTDDFSVFDYGKMPDALPGKGAAMAVMSGYLFERVAQPATWKRLARSRVWDRIGDEAFAARLRKSATFRALKKGGLPTHYRAMVGSNGRRVPTMDLKNPASIMEVSAVNIVPPAAVAFGGRQLYNYNAIHTGLTNFLVPLECIFRFGVPKGSSLLGRLAKNPDYAKQLGLDKVPKAGEWLPFPLVEFSSKLEPGDRMLDHETALNFSGLPGDEFVGTWELTCLLALYLSDLFGRIGVELWDGKFEFLKVKGLMLGDAITPDELRLNYKGIQISKEPLRQYYKKYDKQFVQGMDEAKKISSESGGNLRTILNRKLGIKPQKLDPEFAAAAADMYLALAARVTGLKVFGEKYLDDVLATFKKFGIA